MLKLRRNRSNRSKISRTSENWPGEWFFQSGGEREKGSSYHVGRGIPRERLRSRETEKRESNERGKLKVEEAESSDHEASIFLCLWSALSLLDRALPLVSGLSPFIPMLYV